jgi:hypothetical protein
MLIASVASSCRIVGRTQKILHRNNRRGAEIPDVLGRGLERSRTSAPAKRWCDVGQDRFHDMRIIIHTELVGDSQ